MIHWESFKHEGVCYDLSHLHPRRLTYRQDAIGNKPEINYHVDVVFGLHCFTRGKKDQENRDLRLLYNDKRESRVFDFTRYELSKKLPSIVEELNRRKCHHSGKGNFFVIEILDNNDQPLNYEIYFEASRSLQRGVLNLYVQSAYVRDTEHRNKPKSKPIGFTIILFNILNNKKIKIPI